MNSETKKIWFVVMAIIIIIVATLLYVHLTRKNVINSSAITTNAAATSTQPMPGFPVGLIPSSAGAIQYSESMETWGAIFSMNEPISEAASDYVSDLARMGWTGDTLSANSAAAFINLSNSKTGLSGRAQLLPLSGNRTSVSVTINQ